MLKITDIILLDPFNIELWHYVRDERSVDTTRFSEGREFTRYSSHGAFVVAVGTSV